jgi:phosphoglycolate phosphatase
MAEVQVAGRRFDIDVMVFDKDGTLIDFHIMWGRRATVAIDALLRECGGDDQLESALYHTMGYLPETGTTLGDGPLAVLPLSQADTVMATVLYQHGWAWHESERLIAKAFAPIMHSEPTADVVRPLGNVREAVDRFNRNGVRTVIATSDNRGPTIEILNMLGIGDHFELLYCGDDANLPQKPSVRVLQEIAVHCGVETDRIMMVGDTVGDLSMAHDANAGAKIGVIGGATEEKILAAWSDALVCSIDEIKIIG